MDYHLKAESPSTTSVVGGIGLAVGLLVFPYFNPVVSRKDLPIGFAYRMTQANTALALGGTQANVADTAQIATDRSERDLWEMYLTSITQPMSFFSAEQVRMVKGIWRQACELMGDCPVPITQAGDEGSLQCAWDNGEKYIDIEATPQEAFHWYFRDRKTGEVQGTSYEPIADVGVDFFIKLAEVVKGTAETMG